jgi:hypothetical protein
MTTDLLLIQLILLNYIVAQNGVLSFLLIDRFNLLHSNIIYPQCMLTKLQLLHKLLLNIAL